MDQQELLYLNDMIDGTILIINAAYKHKKISLEEKQVRIKNTLRNKSRLAELEALV